MTQILSSILIPLLLVSQSLFSVPHSHAGSSIVETDGHAARPHAHLHDAHHHQEHDGETSTDGDQVPDHDSDAIYVGDDQLIRDGRDVKVSQSDLTALYFIDDDSAENASSCRLVSQPTSHPLLRQKCDLYLHFLSIRC